MSTHDKHVVKKENIPAIDENVTLDKTRFDKEVNLTAIKVPVHQIQEFSR